ncbi:MAG: nucleotidyltransferase domain-containing protein [Candidatus Korarchaeota archaeon]|nr:nucleotidyltransferase domain-containing protein [Candidatus Korarchaeota archaeon]
MVERGRRRVSALRRVAGELRGCGASLILFGSRVRGEESAASDFDLLLLAEDESVRDRLLSALRREGIPADVHFFRPEEAEKLLPYSSILLDALQEGKILLDEAGASRLVRRAAELRQRGVGRVAGGWRLGG